MVHLAENAVILDGWDDCLVGHTETGAAVYAANKMVERLSKDMSELEAEEYLRYNVFGVACDDDSQWPLFVYLSE